MHTTEKITLSRRNTKFNYPKTKSNVCQNEIKK